MLLSLLSTNPSPTHKHHQRTTNAPPTHRQHTANALPTHHQRTNNAPLTHQQRTTNAAATHQQRTCNAPQTEHDYHTLPCRKDGLHVAAGCSLRFSRRARGGGFSTTTSAAKSDRKHALTENAHGAGIDIRAWVVSLTGRLTCHFVIDYQALYFAHVIPCRDGSAMFFLPGCDGNLWNRGLKAM